MLLSDKIYIPVSSIGRHIVNICNIFTYANPEYYIKKRQKFSVKNISASLYNYRLDTYNGNKYLVLPRGCYKKLVQYFKENNLFFRILDDRIEKNPIDIHLKNTTLEEQQQIIIKLLLENEGGLIEAMPGAGKSIAILGFLAKVKQPMLIIVHESFLQEQWLTEMEKRLTGNFTIGRWDMRHKIKGDVDVGIINTIHNQVETDIKFLNNYGVIVLDECHRCSAPTFLKVMNDSNSKYRIGITGTVERKDQMHILTLDVLGEKLISIGARDLKHRITSFETDIVYTDLNIQLPTTTRWDAENKKRKIVIDIAKTITLLTTHTKRNNIIINKIVKHIDTGYFPLVLSDRVDHVKLLNFRLQELGYNTAILIGNKGKKNKYNWEKLREDDSIQCVIASTKKAEEGLDWPRLSAIHLTCPSSNLPKIKQRIGRVRRKCEGKIVPVVCDYIDDLAYFKDIDEEGEEQIVYILKYSAKKRLKFYKQLQEDYDL